MTEQFSRLPCGVGLGLRWDFIDEIAEDHTYQAIPFFEISPENYMRRGGYFPTALNKIAEKFPILTHGLMMNIGSTDRPAIAYLDQLTHFLNEFNSPFHSDHLCWTGVDGNNLHDLLPLSCDLQTAKRVADHVKRVQDHIGRPLALENISYYGIFGKTMPEVEFVCEVLSRADCLMLLDVNNVSVNATNHNFDPYAYLETLPLDRVVQLHVAGGERRPHMDNLLIDSHGTDVSPAVSKLMQWVLRRIGPKPVIYERDHNIPELGELEDQVRRLQTEYDHAIAQYRQTNSNSVPSATINIYTPPSPPPPLTEETSMMRGFSTIILNRNVLGLVEDFREFGQNIGLPAKTIDRLDSGGNRRLLVYRELVRSGIRSTIHQFLERTSNYLGASFDDDIDHWLAKEGPRSKFLRDVPFEFHHWIAPQWRKRNAFPSVILDLAEHELLDYKISAVPVSSSPEEYSELELESLIEFHASCQIIDYDYPVHELEDDLENIDDLAAKKTSIFAYRDAQHHVRYLRLSPLARAFLPCLMDGQNLKDSVFSAAKSMEISVDDDLLLRIGSLLADLSDRGAILGPRQSPNKT